MKNLKNRPVLFSIILSVMTVVAVTVMIRAFRILVPLVLPEHAYFDFWKVFGLICLGILTGLLAERYSIKKMLRVIAPFLAVWLVLSIAALALWDVSLMFLPVFFTLLTTTVVMHIKKMWLIDSELTEKLVSLASAGHLLEGKSAELRIESGLKLLETIFPLSEAIVFHFDNHGQLAPVGRARNNSSGGFQAVGDNNNESLISRQAAWRESVQLCEEALQWRQTMVLTDKNKSDSAQVAIPLTYGETVVGVLYVRVRNNFERDDQYLLEAFCGQLARNFQRRELRQKDLPNKSWWSFFSTQSAANRLEIIKLINGVMKEQSFSAAASSYLKEAHAIAYLDGTLAYLNRQMRHMAKLNAEHIYELDLFGLLEHFKTDIFNEPRLAIRRVLQTGESYQGELYYPEKNRTLDMQISLVKVPSDNQSIHETNVPMMPACFLITIRDISVIKENEKLRSDMTSLMSHELRTPITSIQGFAELLLVDETINEEAREFLTIIASESQRLSKMLTTFLSVSNLEQSDKHEFFKTPVRLDTVVSEVVGDLQETAKRKRIRLVEQSNTHLPPIAADKGLIARAVSHLVDNAIKYSPERTSVIISTILESEFLRVVVEDRGYGIPKADQEKIWQKFYRVAREGQDKEEESTGLGLSLVKEIIEQHGGEVSVESEVGQGSKFSLKLPRL
ncbi:MAG: ATP-binding protein [Acidobacteriota bacterium]|nr:ATP-binding protein [Acidobacteriota bacterium]